MKSAFFRLGAIACLVSFGVTAQAQMYSGTSGGSVSYTYIDGQYSSADIDVAPNGSVDADGAKFSGSLAMFDSMHILGEFERLRPDDIEVDDGLGNITTIPTDDLDTWGVGFGFHTPTVSRAAGQYRSGLMDSYSLFADVRYLGADSGSTDQNGWSLDAGFRSVNFTRMEVILGAGYEKFEGQNGELTLQGQFLIRLVGNLQARGGVNWNDNISRWNVGLRYNFGNFSIF